jgi:hypothetical protein
VVMRPAYYRGYPPEGSAVGTKRTF